MFLNQVRIVFHNLTGGRDKRQDPFILFLFFSFVVALITYFAHRYKIYQ